MRKRQRSTMNAFQHPHTGNNMLMQAYEVEVYRKLTDNLLAEFQPETEMERQIAQKIIDTNFRLNRLSSIENNMLNFDMMSRETNRNDDDRTEVMCAQAQAWKDEAKSFDILGRYEARLTRQLLLYIRDMRLSAASKDVRLPAAQAVAAHMTAQPVLLDTQLPAASSQLSAQPAHKAALNPKLASFGRTTPLPPPARLRPPQPPLHAQAI
jgi:hypothetical protein